MTKNGNRFLFLNHVKTRTPEHDAILSYCNALEVGLMAHERDLPVVVVGGGPAGMMAGLLFARAGVRTIVLEKHGDFLRDFRGDTVHPSTLDLFAELGLLDKLLARDHDKVPAVG